MSDLTPQPATHPDLQSLRDEIDAVDHELLDLLVRRNALVSNVAAFKRGHGVAIRDHHRERALLDDRCRVAGACGLRPEVIESLFRIVLWASRDRQAALGAQVPPDVVARRVAIIGAHGGMGRCMRTLFTELGHEVLPCDLDTALTPVDAARAADVVLLSVPIDSTVEVALQIGPHCPESSLLMDVTSTKTAPVQAMLEASRCSVIGAHPLFGPSVHSLQGQRIVLTPGRSVEGTAWLKWLHTMLEARGLELLETTPEEHDRAMGVVQVLTHYATEVIGRTVQQLGVPVEHTLRFTSPVYLIELLMAARHFAQSSDLYAAIQMHNPEREHVVATFRAAALELDEVLAARDSDAFQELFADVGAFFGDFSTQAMEQSSFLIDRLVERA